MNQTFVSIPDRHSTTVSLETNPVVISTFVSWQFTVEAFLDENSTVLVPHRYSLTRNLIFIVLLSTTELNGTTASEMFGQN